MPLAQRSRETTPAPRLVARYYETDDKARHYEMVTDPQHGLLLAISIFQALHQALLPNSACRQVGYSVRGPHGLALVEAEVAEAGIDFAEQIMRAKGAEIYRLRDQESFGCLSRDWLTERGFTKRFWFGRDDDNDTVENFSFLLLLPESLADHAIDNIRAECAVATTPTLCNVGIVRDAEGSGWAIVDGVVGAVGRPIVIEVARRLRAKRVH